MIVEVKSVLPSGFTPENFPTFAGRPGNSEKEFKRLLIQLARSAAIAARESANAEVWALLISPEHAYLVTAGFQPEAVLPTLRIRSSIVLRIVEDGTEKLNVNGVLSLATVLAERCEQQATFAFAPQLLVDDDWSESGTISSVAGLLVSLFLSFYRF
jgi:hypothetical protein